MHLTFLPGNVKHSSTTSPLPTPCSRDSRTHQITKCLPHVHSSYALSTADGTSLQGPFDLGFRFSDPITSIKFTRIHVRLACYDPVMPDVFFFASLLKNIFWIRTQTPPFSVPKSNSEHVNSFKKPQAHFSQSSFTHQELAPHLQRRQPPRRLCSTQANPKPIST